jgi:hypothetical protein
MDSDFFEEGINWEGTGYFGVPKLPPETSPTPSYLADRPDLLWTVAFQRATQGDIQLLPSLIDLYKQSQDETLQHLCVTLLGDAGPMACFPAIIREIERELNETTRYEVTLDWCDALFVRGRLADVPLMLAAYENLAYLRDADIIPCRISELLEYPIGRLIDPRNFESNTAYRAAVIGRYEQLVQELGSDQALVFGGKRFGVVPFARMFLDRVRHPHVPSFWRRKFEASTGINCTAFYRDEIFQPLTAAATIEGFLESPEAAQYQDGPRYFFGHRIPD